MSDNIPLTKRDEIVRESKIDEPDLRRATIEEALPAHFVDEYPQFVQFLQTYYDFLEAEEGNDRLIERLRDVRNPEIAKDENADKLRAEYGPGIPETGTLTDAEALRIFESWYQSRGNKDAMEAYFRLFLNTDDVEVIYPRDNMLIVDGGNWDNSAGRYTDAAGHLDEVTMVLQDDVYYQIYSYLIRSGISIADWGPTFREIAHPAGWNLFGEVRLTELARAEQYQDFTDSGARSPTQVPGFQIKDANLLILGAALFMVADQPAVGYTGQFQVSQAGRKPQALSQFITKYFDIVVPKSSEAHDLDDVNKNLMVSPYTLGGLGEYTLQQFIDGEDLSSKRRPARIDTTNLISNHSFQTDLTSWTSSLQSNGTATVTNGEVTITETTDGSGTPRIYQSISCTIGETYVAFADCRGTTNGKPKLSVNNSASGTSLAEANIFGFDEPDSFGAASHQLAITFTATAATHNLLLYIDAQADGAQAIFERVFVRKISL